MKRQLAGAAPVPVAAAVPISTPGEIAVSPSPPPLQNTGFAPLDFEPPERPRAATVKIPWRQLSLMATLCFGLAYFVLPDRVNDIVQWPLYALGAMSFYVNFSARRRKKEQT